MKVSIIEQQCFIDNYIVVPNVWILLKNYHDRFGTQDAIWRTNSDHADIIGFSVYSWNEEYMLETAKRIKEEAPDTIIVFGGPQPDYKRGYLMMHPFIDCIVPADGEQPFCDIIDGKDLDTIDGVITRNSMNTARPMFKEWPGSAILTNEGYIENYVDRTHMQGKQATYIYESTRGCPYQCVYCDWGGGTYTKLRKKPVDLIKEELESLAKNGIDLLRFQDSNFGILKRDVEIAEWIVHLKETYGCPSTVHVNWAKQNKGRVADIMRIFYNAELIHFYKISLQDLDGDVGVKIKRKDVPWDEQMEIGNQLKEELGMPIKIEIILGLPGQTKENFINEYVTMMEAGVEVPAPYPCQVLPNTELAEEAYMNEHNIKTSRVVQGTYPFKELDVFQTIVTSTSDMSFSDWVEMLIFSNLMVALETGRILDVGDFKSWPYLHKDEWITAWGGFFNNIERAPKAFEMIDNVRQNIYENLETGPIFNLKPLVEGIDEELALDCYFHATMVFKEDIAREFYAYAGCDWTTKDPSTCDIREYYGNGLITITNSSTRKSSYHNSIK